MHIIKIEAENIIGLQRAEIVCAQPITLVAGLNEAGKTSLRDAIALALTGQPSRVSLKKDLGQLVNDTNGAKKGRVTILGTGDASGEMLLGQFRLPKGEHELGPALENHQGFEFIKILLDPQQFAAMKPDDRRKALFKLTGLKPTPKGILEELKTAGCNMALAEEVMPMIHGGFPAMKDEASRRMSEAKAEWKAITGDQWGSEKGETWELEIPMGDAVSQEQIDQAIAAAHKTQHDIERGMQARGETQAAINQLANFDARTDELKQKAGELNRATAKRNATQKDLDAWQPKLANLRAQLGQAGVYKCPCCEETLQLVDGALVAVSGGLSEAERKKAKADLSRAEDAVALLGRTLANDETAITAAVNAQAQLDEHLASKPEGADEEKLAKIDEALQQLRELLPKQQAKAEALKERHALLSTQEKTNRDATKKHAEIMAWSALADQFAPTGIPARMLAKAIDPFNTALAVLARLSGWKVASLDSDMNLLYGGRPYALNSESARWRCDAMIALVIAQMSGLKLAVFDRMDVLHVKARPQFLGMVAELVKFGSIDSVLIMATLKEPLNMPAPVQFLWIDKGIVPAQVA